jgi:hypothetical protein
MSCVSLRIPALLSLSVAVLAATGCEGRLGLELKGEGDTAYQDSGVGPGDTEDTDNNNPNDTGDSDDTAGGAGNSTSPAVNRNTGFEGENWRDVMWRTRKSRRRGL